MSSSNTSDSQAGPSPATIGRAVTWSSAAFLSYVLVGYPAIVKTAARFVRRPEPTLPEQLPHVSMVICAHNEADVISAKLDNVLDTDYPADLLEVIVVDDGSEDGTAEIVRDHKASVRLVSYQPRQGKATAMNHGVEASKHDLIALSDAETMWRPDAIHELVRAISTPGVGAVNGTYRPTLGGKDVTDGETAYRSYEEEVKVAESAVGSLTSISGAMLMVRRDVMPKLPSDLINDDFYIGMRVAKSGLRVVASPEAICTEAGASSLADDAIRRRRMTAGRWQTVPRWREVLPLQRPVVMWQVLSHKYARLLLPFAMGTAAVGSVVAVADKRERNVLDVAVFAVQVAGYAAAAAAPALDSAPQPLRKMARVSRYLVRTNYASLEGLYMHLQRREGANLWQRITKEHN